MITSAWQCLTALYIWTCGFVLVRAAEHAVFPAASHATKRHERRFNTDCANDPEGRSHIVKCFIEVLDEWTWNLWLMKDSLATLNCTTYMSMRNCIYSTPSCSVSDVIAISRSLTEMITYNRDSGTFLHSFFALGYACEEGRDALIKHKDCLRRSSETVYLLETVDAIYDEYVTQQKLENVEKPEDHMCTYLWDKIDERTAAAKADCGDSEDVAALVCHTVRRPFVMIDKAKFDACGKLCPGEETVSSQGQNGNTGICSRIEVHVWLVSVTSIISGTLAKSYLPV